MKNVIVDKNNLNILYTLKNKDTFTYNCVRCGKKYTRVFSRKSRIPEYSKLYCLSCCKHKQNHNIPGYSKDNPLTLSFPYNSKIFNDFISQKRNRVWIKYNCTKCDKTVITEFTSWDYNKSAKLRKTMSLFQCRECNCFDTKSPYYEKLKNENDIYNNSFKHTDDGYKIIESINDMKRLKTNNEKIAYHCSDPNCRFYKNELFKMNMAKKSRIKEYLKHGKLYCKYHRFLKDYPIENANNARRETYIKHFGTDHHMKNPEFKEKFLDAITNYDTHNINVCNEYLYYGLRFQSKPELAFYIHCLDNNISVMKNNKIRFEYYDKNGNSHVYIPDFMVNGKLYEIKGPQFVNKETGEWLFPFNKLHSCNKPLTQEEKEFLDDLYERKHQCALTNDVNILYENEYIKYLQYVCDKYGKSYMDKYLRNNPYNPSYWCLSACLDGHYIPMYFVPKYINDSNFNKGITPFDCDNNTLYANITGKGLTPFDI